MISPMKKSNTEQVCVLDKSHIKTHTIGDYDYEF